MTIKITRRVNTVRHHQIARDIQNQLITYLVIGSPYTFPTPTLGKRFTNCFRAWKLSKMKNVATVTVTTEKDA